MTIKGINSIAGNDWPLLIFYTKFLYIYFRENCRNVKPISLAVSNKDKIDPVKRNGGH